MATRFIFSFIFSFTTILAHAESPVMDPQTRELLDQINKSDSPPLETQPVDQIRKNMEEDLPPSSVKVASVQNLTIPSTDGAFPIRIYTPFGQGPFPVLVYYHGGGWVFGSLNLYDDLCRKIAVQSGYIVVSVGYRLAPEYKFPIPLNDSYAAALWVSKHIQDYNGIPSKLVVGGDSAGGNLTAAVTLLSKERGTPKFSAQILAYPVTSVKLDTSSYQKYAKNYFVTKDVMEWLIKLYLNNPSEANNPLVSPIEAKDLSHLPPALFVLSDFDVLHDEGLQYAELLKNAGVPVKVESFPTMHGFLTIGNQLQITQQALTDIANFLMSISNSEVQNSK